MKSRGTSSPCAVPSLLVAGLAALALLGPAATAEELVLAPRYEPGDVYTLHLRATTDTEASAKAGRRDTYQEKVTLDYSATVLVLEVDERGQPTRERHGGVRLTFERPDERGSLFRDDTMFEVRRDDRGHAALFARGGRAEPEIERIVTDLLRWQFEYGVGPALFDPGRPVQVGDSWPLDPGLARRFARAQGVEVMSFSAPATATLKRDARAGGGLVVAYEIPIGWFEVERMREDLRTSESEARLRGEIRLPAEPEGGPIVYSSNLALRMDGVVGSPGSSQTFPWTVRSQKLANQRTRLVER